MVDRMAFSWVVDSAARMAILSVDGRAVCLGEMRAVYWVVRLGSYMVVDSAV